MLDPPRPAGQGHLRIVTGPESGSLRRYRLRLEPHHKLIGVGLLLVLCTFGLLAWTATTARFTSDRIGLRAPTFSLPSLDDGGSVGTADLRGRPAIVVFWSPGCAPCARELRQLQGVWERHRSGGLVVLGIQVGFISDPDAPGFLAANGVTFPNVHDRSGVVSGAFGILGVPEVHFMDAQWRIQAIGRGDTVGVDERAGLLILGPIQPDVLTRRVAELLGAGSLDPS